MFKKLFSKSKNYNVYVVNIKDNSKKLVKEFKKDFLAKEYVKEQLDYSLKIMSSKTKNEWTLAQEFLKQRKYKFLIENDDFDEDGYVKQMALRIFNEQLAFYINRAFGIVKEGKALLKDIENCDILEINRLDEDMEIIYKKEDKEKYLTIKSIYHMSSMHGLGMLFEIDDKPLENEKKNLLGKYTKEKCDTLKDIKQIVKIYHLKNDRDPYYRTDFIEILYKDKENNTNSYRLRFIDYDEDEIRLDIQNYENIYSFKTEVLENRYKTQLDYSYDDEKFYPIYYKNALMDTLDEDGELEPILIRTKHGEHNIKAFKDLEKKVFFKINDEGVYSDNLIYQNHCLLDMQTYKLLSQEKKDKLRHFLSVMELFINED